mmetsp:Transcript_634/g.1420  ORF Transcript_634/g.1420 Transcript_634/m.1420 type:complete len:220 (-) Transcript_634:112-771(-)
MVEAHPPHDLRPPACRPQRLRLHAWEHHRAEVAHPRETRVGVVALAADVHVGVAATRLTARIDDGGEAGCSPWVEAVGVVLGAFHRMYVHSPRLAWQRRLERAVAVARAESILVRVWARACDRGVWHVAENGGRALAAPNRTPLRPPETRLTIRLAAKAAVARLVAAPMNIMAALATWRIVRPGPSLAAEAVIASARTHRRLSARKLREIAIVAVAGDW